MLVIIVDEAAGECCPPMSIGSWFYLTLFTALIFRTELALTVLIFLTERAFTALTFRTELALTVLVFLTDERAFTALTFRTGISY
jgi:hypothetical protein